MVRRRQDLHVPAKAGRQDNPRTVTSHAAMNKHIPAPWLAQHSGTGDATVIACPPDWKNKDGTQFKPVIVSRTDWDTARLIAAAPELLEALQVAKDCLWLTGDRFNDHREGVSRVIDAALAKVKGL